MLFLTQHKGELNLLSALVYTFMNCYIDFPNNLKDIQDHT